jgi:hypothetical protein
MVGKGKVKVAQNFKKVIDYSCFIVFAFISALVFVFRSLLIENFTS